MANPGGSTSTRSGNAGRARTRRIGTADIGGTHARFALATIAAGRVVALDKELTLKTGDCASFQTAWQEFARHIGTDLPPEIAIAFAGSVAGDLLKLTNNPWTIQPARLCSALGIHRYVLLNDFGAIAHAVASLDDDAFDHICGPKIALPESGMITIVGPGTGLGVAALLRRQGDYEIIETEGGHVDFAPLDQLEDQILTILRDSFGRVSVERLVAGNGLANIYSALAVIEKRPFVPRDDMALWNAALDGHDSLAAAALDRFCLILGAVIGDLALAQGAKAVVIAGSLGQRLREYLPGSGFASRFVAKGRFERQMGSIPIKLINHPQPGLLGAATAFAHRYPHCEAAVRAR